MFLGGNSITNTPENRHTLGATDILKVLVHDIPYNVNFLSDLALSDHWQILLHIVMKG